MGADDMEARTPAPEGEPVAWRYRYPNDPTWQLTQDRDQAFTNTGEVQPLYAPPVVPVGVSREEIARIIEPEFFSIGRAGPGYEPHRASAFRKADAIMAALRPTDTGRE
jgi:hypothetical protein